MSTIRLGLKAIVARPGMISSSTINGYAHLGTYYNINYYHIDLTPMTEDFDSRMLLGIMQSKVSPFNTQSNLEMNPVDFIARFICDLREDYEERCTLLHQQVDLSEMDESSPSRDT